VPYNGTKPRQGRQIARPVDPAEAYLNVRQTAQAPGALGAMGKLELARGDSRASHRQTRLHAAP